MFYEMLSERTLALAQRDLLAHPDRGYAPYMVEFLAPVLRKCVENGILIVGNFGSASPMNAARRLHALAPEQGVRGLRVALVEGDDLSDRQIGRASCRERMCQ